MRQWTKFDNKQMANVKGDRTKAASPLTCGIERLFMTLQDYSFTLSIGFYQSMAFAQHSRTSSSHSPVCHKTCHKTQILVTTAIVTMFPDFLARRTGHWSLAVWLGQPWPESQLHLMTTSPPRHPSWPCDCQDLSHQQSIQCQPSEHAQSTLPRPEQWGGDLQWRHGPGAGWVWSPHGSVSTVSRVLIWPGRGRGRSWHQASFILHCISGCIHSD